MNKSTNKKPMIYDYAAAKKEEVPCNLCGKDDFFVLADRAGRRAEVRTCMCKNCGLI